jgi:peroxiredoxin
MATQTSVKPSNSEGVGFIRLLRGDPAPRFRVRSVSNPGYNFDTVAGRTVLLCFGGSAGSDLAKPALAAVRARPDLFDDTRASFFFVSNDPQDEAQARVGDSYPGYRTFWDFDGAVARLFGVLPADPMPVDKAPFRPLWVVVDRQLRVLEVIPFARDRSDIARAIAAVEAVPVPRADDLSLVQAPVLLLPNVLEPELCAELIAGYRQDGGEPSGFMREENGKTVLRTDPGHKLRRDWTIGNLELIGRLQERFKRRIVPEIERVHYFRVTRMERYLVGCYTAEEGGHFRPHRDNTTKGTAHRRYAVSVNLNEDFEGGTVSFPEYGPRGYKPPPGGALVFSCSLLHCVAPVTRGERFAFLPFLYDDAAAKIREANNAFLDEGLGEYRA